MLHSDVIEQMRFKQRLKVIQSLEDTAKRSVVGDAAAIVFICFNSCTSFAQRSAEI